MIQEGKAVVVRVYPPYAPGKETVLGIHPTEGSVTKGAWVKIFCKEGGQRYPGPTDCRISEIQRFRGRVDRDFDLVDRVVVVGQSYGVVLDKPSLKVMVGDTLVFYLAFSEVKSLDDFWSKALAEDPLRNIPISRDWLKQNNDPAWGLLEWLWQRQVSGKKIETSDAHPRKEVGPRTGYTAWWYDLGRGNYYNSLPTILFHDLGTRASRNTPQEAWKWALEAWRKAYRDGKLKDEAPWQYTWGVVEKPEPPKGFPPGPAWLRTTLGG